MWEKILKKFHYVPENKCDHEKLLLKLEIEKLEKREHELRNKELILYMISELLHNKKDRTETFSNNEVNNMLSKARCFTPHYGSEHPDLSAMDSYIEYLANDAWIKVFGKPAVDSSVTIKEFKSQRRLNVPSTQSIC